MKIVQYCITIINEKVVL